MISEFQQARLRLNSILGIDEASYSQDWEVEASHPKQLNRYIQLYESNKLSIIEKQVIMHLILGCFEEYHALDHDWTYWPQIAEILNNDSELHRERIEYYQCYDEEDGEDIFPITKKIREVAL